MKKTFLLKPILLLLLASNLYAEMKLDNFYFGVSYATGSGEIEEESSSTTTADFDLTSKAFKVGYILDTEDRIVISYDILTKKLENRYTWYGRTEPEIKGINFDAVSVLTISKIFQPFLSLGIGSYSLEDSAKYYTEDYDLSALSVNYGIGFYYIVDFIELEVSYNGKYLSWADVEYNNETTSTVSKLSYFSVGLNIHF